jgi:hypothetical protein
MDSLHLIKELSDALFTINLVNNNDNIKQNQNNDFVDKHASSARADMRVHMDIILTEFKKWVCVFKNVNKLNVADRVVRYVLKSLLTFTKHGNNTRLLILVESVSVLDLLYAGFYVYGVFVAQILYRKKTFKIVTGKNTNEKATSEFPGCHPGVVRVLLKPENMTHAMKGIQFAATMMNDIGDGKLMYDTYQWWYNDFVRRRFVEIPSKGIPLSFASAMVRFKVADRFMPYVDQNVLYIPNLFNPVVYSSRDNKEGQLWFYHFVPRTNDKLAVIRLSEQFRDFMKDTFGWYGNRISTKEKSVLGRVDFQMVITYLKLVSSMYLMVHDRSRKLSRETLGAMCHFFQTFQTGGGVTGQWNAVQPIVSLVVGMIRTNNPRRLDMWTVQEQVFFGKNINNNTRNRFFKDLLADKHLDVLSTHFADTDPTFRPMLAMYVHLINWVILVLMGNTTLNSGFLEFSDKKASIRHFENYINIHDPKDERVLVISQWLVLRRLRVSDDTIRAHTNKVIKVVFDEAVRAIKKRSKSGILRFVFRR